MIDLTNAERYVSTIQKMLIEKLGIKEGILTLSKVPYSVIEMYFMENINIFPNDNYDKVVKIIIKEYRKDIPGSIEQKVKEKLIYIKERYTDAMITNPELGEAIKFLIETYLGIDDANRFIDLMDTTKEDKKEKKKGINITWIF
jgi:hypothetical protein